MSRGALLFAFNSPTVNYYEMAVATAKRINRFLDIPVSLVTDDESVPEVLAYNFDNTFFITADKTNSKQREIWINKGRYRAFELSPYDETLLLDTDYMINSRQLLKPFDIYDDFCCHNSTSFLMSPKEPQEKLSKYSHQTLWATVVAFKKTNRTSQIFQCLEMVQKNYYHYANIHSFVGGLYRNDYGLTLALDIVNGHCPNPRDIIPWNLVHVHKEVQIRKETDTQYYVMRDNWKRGKIRKEYIIVTDTDFHCMSKKNFMELQ